MKYDRLPIARIRDDDPPEVQEAIRFLIDAGYRPKQPAGLQIMLDQRSNYYPSTGTLFVHGEAKARTAKGLEALSEWIADNPATR